MIIPLNLSTTSVQALVDHLETRIEDLEDANRILEARASDLGRTVSERSARIFSLGAELDALKGENARLKGLVAIEDFDWASIDGMDFIPAIKEFRNATGLGLRESKEAVEQAFSSGKIDFAGGFVPGACR